MHSNIPVVKDESGLAEKLKGVLGLRGLRSLILLLLADTWLADRRSRGARRRAVAAAAGAAVMAGCAIPGGTARDGAREYAAGRYARSAALYRHAIAQGDARPQMLYNLGTALVAGDAPANRHLRRCDHLCRCPAAFSLERPPIVRAGGLRLGRRRCRARAAAAAQRKAGSRVG